MEGSWSYEQKTLISELIMGFDFAKQLRGSLNSESNSETRDFLIQGILSSYEKALLILKWSGPVVQQPQPAPAAAASGVPESPLSVNGSPRSEDFDKGVKDQYDNRDMSKKRKMLPKWTDQVKINPETGLEGPHDDGYSWRKYGQKDILGAMYPRSYYRCTYRNTQNCWATKQVQRSDEDPTVFEITYRGTHTCSYAGAQNLAPAPAPVSPQKQEQQQQQQQQQKIKINGHFPNGFQQNESEEILSKLKAGLRVDTQNLDNIGISFPPFSFPPTSFGLLQTEHYSSSPLVNSSSNLAGSFSSSFFSPSTPESNYFSASTYQMHDMGQIQRGHRSESDLTEIISANTSSTNSPIIDLEFSLDQVGIDPNFPFDQTFFP